MIEDDGCVQFDLAVEPDVTSKGAGSEYLTPWRQSIVMLKEDAAMHMATLHF